MQQILILGGGAAGLAAALAAAQTAEGRAHITMLDKNAKVGKKLLATGNGRCNLDNRDITPERYFTSSPKALRRLLSAVDEAAPLAWFESLGLYPRTDEAGRVYPYSNQAADVLALLEHHLSRLGVEVRTGCTVQNLSQSRGGYTVQIETEAGREPLRADAVICAMGGDAGPQFGTDGFGTRFAAQCGGRMAPLYPCLTALQCAHPRKSLAGIRAKGCASLLDGADGRVLARETGEVQFTEYGLSGICIMQLSGWPRGAGRSGLSWPSISSLLSVKPSWPRCSPSGSDCWAARRRSSGWACCPQSWAAPSGPMPVYLKTPAPCPPPRGRNSPPRPSAGGSRA